MLTKNPRIKWIVLSGFSNQIALWGDEIEKYFTPRGYDVHLLLTGSAGNKMSAFGMKPSQLAESVISQALLQHALLLKRLNKKNGRKVLVIEDGGIPDTLGVLAESKYLKIFKDCGISGEYLDMLYDGVVIATSKKSPKQAVIAEYAKLSNRLQIRLIKQADLKKSPASALLEMIRVITDAAGIEVPAPYTMQRKFLAKFNQDQVEQSVYAVNIEQTYLAHSESLADKPVTRRYESRLRKITPVNSNSPLYYHGTKMPAGSYLARFSSESRIDETMYNFMLGYSAANGFRQINKLRLYYIHDSHLFWVDKFSPDSLAEDSVLRKEGMVLVEIGVNSMESKIHLPSWLISPAEVTENRSFGNRQIARKEDTLIDGKESWEY